MARTIHLAEIGTSAVNLIGDTLNIDSLILYIKRSDLKYETLTQRGYAQHAPESISSDVLTELLQDKTHGVLDSYNDQTPAVHTFLNKLHAELILPLIFENDLVGLLVLGPKKSEQLYGLDDYLLLETLGNEAAVALHNADLFEQVKRERDLVTQLLSHEREVDERKSEFIMIASHNLRTPLTVIKGYLDNLLFENKGLPDGVKEYLQIISDESQYLSLLTEELLAAASVEKGNLRLNKESCNIRDLVRNLVRDYQKNAQRKQLSLFFENPEDALPNVSVDKLRMGLAIGNLIDNAIKFTQVGQITIRIVHDKQNINVEISDTGPGIPEVEIPFLFTKFHQVRKSHLEPIPGIGIGLYIVKLIAQSHGGDVSVTSEVGHGSTFTVSLPVIS
jgi:signal transduction histidine kinase